jgi:LysM repeat protein
VICPKCGKEYDDKMVFCTKCGVKLVNNTSEINVENDNFSNTDASQRFVSYQQVEKTNYVPVYIAICITVAVVVLAICATVLIISLKGDKDVVYNGDTTSVAESETETTTEFVEETTEETTQVYYGDTNQKQYKTYIVQSDDSLYKIAQKMYGDGSRYEDILEANGMTEDNISLSVGDELIIP